MTESSIENQPARVGNRLRAVLEGLGLSQKDLADEYNCSASYISDLVNSKCPMPMKMAYWMAHKYSLNLDWLFTGRGDMFTSPNLINTSPDYVTKNTSTEDLLSELRRRVEAAEQPQGERMLTFTESEEAFEQWEGEERFRALPYMRDAAAAGAGRVVEDEVEGYVVVHERIAKSAGRLVCVRISGDSMAPTLPDGSIVAVQISDGDPRDHIGQIVAARTDDGEVTVKRLAAAKHCLVLRPDNPLYDLIEVDPTVQPNPLIGPVVWAWLDLT